MTFWDLLACLRRNPAVALLGVVLTLGTAYWAGSAHGVFASTTTVTLVAPVEQGDNPLDEQPKSLLDVSGIVAAAVGGTGLPFRFSSQNVPLSGTGVLDGYSVHQQDAGAQWNQAFQRPEIVVQVTGPTKYIVEMRMARLLESIDTTLQGIQGAAGVDSRVAISARRDSDRPGIKYQIGSKKRAIAMASIVGLSLTLVLACVVDRLRGVQEGIKRAHERG